MNIKLPTEREFIDTYNVNRVHRTHTNDAIALLNWLTSRIRELNQPQPELIPFTWEKWQSGKYTLECRDSSIKPEIWKKVNTIGKYPIIGSVECADGKQESRCWTLEGLHSYTDGENCIDLFLRPIQQEMQDVDVHFYKNEMGELRAMVFKSGEKTLLPKKYISTVSILIPKQ